ncbi:MAG TPA: maltodextrin glucosidase [Thermoflexales bacterium]|nr:maltodextrin glucosidase [Thermoflexales bacterium]
MNWIDSLHHDGSSKYVSGEMRIGKTARIRVRADVAAPITKMFVRTCPDGEQKIAPMTRAADEGVCAFWEADLPLNMPRTGYRFLIHADDGDWWLNQQGAAQSTPTDAADFRILADASFPSWVQDAIFYQIFPDRFADGDPAGNVQNGEYSCYGREVTARAWGEQPRKHNEGGGVEFFGGDLQGIAQKLDYLRDLGVNALYINPIFTSPSNHKYDVADYYHVDPHFGGEKALIELRRALDQRGMRLMLDMVPNHCSSVHPWFLDAQANPRGPTAEFFTFHHHPNDYESWLGVRSLPKLNYKSQRLREVMFEDDDAIMRYWLRAPFRIDGWRLDVANMMGKQGATQLGHKIGRAIRRAIKREKPDAYLLGEHFFDGTPHLQGDELDASMNYRGFTFPLLNWLAGFDMASVWGMEWASGHHMPTLDFAAQLRQFAAAVPWQIALNQLNLLGSHDTPRVLSVVHGDLAQLRVAAALLFTYLGAPCVYYGEEIGLEGWGDPDCRRCMEWDESKWNKDVRGLYSGLMALRKANSALRHGGLQWLMAEHETLAFLREDEHHKVIVVAKRGADDAQTLNARATGLADGAVLREFFSGAEQTVSGGFLSLAGLAGPGAQIWIA